MARKVFEVQVETIKKAAADKRNSELPVFIYQDKPIFTFKNIVNDFGLSDDPHVANNVIFAKYYHVRSASIIYKSKN